MSAGRVVVVAIVLACASASPAAAGMADRVGTTFGFMVADFIKAFQPAEGIVISAEGGDIFLDVNAATGAQVGQEYTIFRKGNPFVHPLTGKPLGRYEQVLGYAHVRRVNAEFSVATFVPVPDAPAPRPEDGARITRGRIKVAVTPVLDMTELKADVRRVPFLMATALERSRRFHVIDPLAVSDMFAADAVRVEEVLGRPERAVRVARNLEVMGWIVPVLIERRGLFYLDVTYISAVTGTALFSRRELVVASSATEEQRFPWEPRVED
ncbi:MAG TPA: hypothetical protein VMR23_11870 [Candidatus Limnocylindria bacterium]|nr:hypothetical protein [Candidatus Limnocylindria bacterium]